MLDQFQVRDLPLRDVVLALETTPLRAISAALESQSCIGVLVLDGEGTGRGLVMRDAIERHASRLQEMHVGLLPALGVVELDGASTVLDAARAVARAGVGAIVCRVDESRDPQVMLRDEMLNITDWQPLIDARARRQAPISASAAPLGGVSLPTPKLSVILL